VTGVEINFATRRARVRWDEQRIQLSDILAAIVAIGYNAPSLRCGEERGAGGKERRRALWRVFVAGFGMMQVMMYAIPAYVAGDGDMTPDVELLLRWASLVLTVPVVFYSAAAVFRGAWRDCACAGWGMDVPVALGVGAAFAASVWATLTASRRGLLRLGDDVRLFPARRAFPGDDRAAAGGQRHRGAGKADAGVRHTPRRLIR
jgi:Cu2+-exporting ATPase